MDHFKFRVLREKWRLYFEEGQRDVFDTCSSEESEAKRRALKENKVYVELFQMSATNVSKDEHVLDSDFPKFQLEEKDSDDTTAEQYEHNTHEQEPMLDQVDSISSVDEDKSQLQEPEVVIEKVHASDEFAQKHEEPMLAQVDSKLPKLDEENSQLQEPEVAIEEVCASDEFAQKHEETMSAQVDSNLAKLDEEKSQLQEPEVAIEEVHASDEFAQKHEEPMFAQKGEQRFTEAQIEITNETNSQIDLQNNCEGPSKLIFRHILSHWRPYLIRPYMHRNAQYKMSLQPILEGEEPGTIQELVQPELEQQLHHVEKKSDLESYEEEQNMEQDTEFDDSHNGDYADAQYVEEEQSTDEEQSMFETSRFSTADAQNVWRNKNLHTIVLICIAICIKTMEGNILEELLNYASQSEVIMSVFIFFTLLCLCKVFDSMEYGEDEIVERVNDLADNGARVEDEDVPLPWIDQMRGGPQPDIQPAMAAPEDLEPMPLEQDMERE